MASEASHPRDAGVPLVSIVMPLYNGEAYVREAIDAVVAQSVKEWELVIVDDGSTDACARIVAEAAADDRRIKLFSQRNGGVGAARNAGLGECAGAAAFVCFLDQDDVWEPETLATLLAALESSPVAPAAHGLPQYVDSAGRECTSETHDAVFLRLTVAGYTVRRLEGHEPTSFYTLACRNCMVTPGLVLIRRGALMAAGPFDTAAGPCTDWDLWIRLARQGDFAFVDRTIIKYRCHESNASRDRDSMVAASAYVFHKALASGANSERQRSALTIGAYLMYRSLTKIDLRRGRLLKAFGHAALAVRYHLKSHSRIGLFTPVRALQRLS